MDSQWYDKSKKKKATAGHFLKATGSSQVDKITVLLDSQLGDVLQILTRTDFKVKSVIFQVIWRLHIKLSSAWGPGC